MIPNHRVTSGLQSREAVWLVDRHRSTFERVHRTAAVAVFEAGEVVRVLCSVIQFSLPSDNQNSLFLTLRA